MNKFLLSLLVFLLPFLVWGQSPSISNLQREIMNTGRVRSIDSHLIIPKDGLIGDRDIQFKVTLPNGRKRIIKIIDNDFSENHLVQIQNQINQYPTINEHEARERIRKSTIILEGSEGRGSGVVVQSRKEGNRVKTIIATATHVIDTLGFFKFYDSHNRPLLKRPDKIVILNSRDYNNFDEDASIIVIYHDGEPLLALPLMDMSDKLNFESELYSGGFDGLKAHESDPFAFEPVKFMSEGLAIIEAGDPTTKIKVECKNERCMGRSGSGLILVQEDGRFAVIGTLSDQNFTAGTLHFTPIKIVQDLIKRERANNPLRPPSPPIKNFFNTILNLFKGDKDML